MNYFFSGWGTPPSWCTAEISTEKIRCIDSTEIIDKYRNINTITEKLAKEIRHPEQTTLFGWSTGAMIALALAAIIQPQKLVLAAPTRQFTASSQFPEGVSGEILDKMIRTITLAPEKTLLHFFRSCGIPASQLPKLSYSVETLHAGLVFLKETTIPLQKLHNTEIRIIHGTADYIIPLPAGERLANELNGDCQRIPHGSHFSAMEKIRPLLYEASAATV